jgi:hypothetical protein
MFIAKENPMNVRVPLVILLKVKENFYVIKKYVLLNLNETN